MSTTSRRLQGCPITLALAAWLIASPATAAWLEQPGQARPAELPSGHDNPSIRRALALLPGRNPGARRGRERREAAAFTRAGPLALVRLRAGRRPANLCQLVVSGVYRRRNPPARGDEARGHVAPRARPSPRGRRVAGMRHRVTNVQGAPPACARRVPGAGHDPRRRARAARAEAPRPARATCGRTEGCHCQFRSRWLRQIAKAHRDRSRPRFHGRIAAMRSAAMWLLVAASFAGLPSAQPAIDPTAALLQEIIRLDTTNPPGREGLVGDLLAAQTAAARLRDHADSDARRREVPLHRKAPGRRQPAPGAARRARGRRWRRAREVDRRPVCRPRPRRLRLRPRRDRLQGWHGGLRPRRDAAGREQGAAVARRDPAGGGRRGIGAVQHDVARARSLGRDRLRVRAERRRLDHRRRARHGAVRQHLDRRQVVGRASS